MHDQKIQQIGVVKYVGRIKEAKRQHQRHSHFYVGLYGQSWVNYHLSCAAIVADLLRLTPNKRPDYQGGQRAMSLILSAL